MKRILEVLLVLAFFALPWLAFGVAAPPQAARPASPPRPNVDARIRAALALASAQRRPAPAPSTPAAPAGCGCYRTCTCKPDECNCSGVNGLCSTDCDCGLKKKKPLTLNDALLKAIAENKPLLVWVNEVCPPCERAMPGYLHHHAAEFCGDDGRRIADSCVIVTVPDGNRVVWKTVIPGCPDDLVAQVRAALDPAPRITYYIEPPRPVMMPMVYYGGGGCASGG